jgi:hypothetical protein
MGGFVPEGVTQENWADDFDSYDLGQFLDGDPEDGGWKGWDNDPSFGAYVVNDAYYSDPHSVEIVGNVDLVHEYEGYISGQWTYTAWQYLPADFSGESYFILLSLYEDGLGNDNKWALVIRFDSVEQIAESEYDNIDLPLITGRWVELRAEIDLDNDWFQFYYDDELLIEKAWTATCFNDYTGPLDISAVDLFANNASVVYYDDISLVQKLEYAIDDTTPQFFTYKGADWSTIQHGDAIGGKCHYHEAGEGNNIVAWRVDNVVAPGTYDVYVWKFDHRYSKFMATNAQYIVKDATGLSKWIYVDQSTPDDEWIMLGTFTFSEMGGQGIGLTDKANGYVVADGVKLVYVP